MKKIFALFVILFLSACGAPRQDIVHHNFPDLTTENKSTILLIRDNSIMSRYNTAIKVCGRQESIDLARGEKTSVDVPSGKCKIKTDYSEWQGGGYEIEVDALAGQVHNVRVSPRDAYVAATFLGIIGTMIEGHANKGQSGPFSLTEEK